VPAYLLSGGLDSITLLHWMVRKPWQFGIDTLQDADVYGHLAVHFRTGMAIDDRLSEICRHHCDLLDVEYIERTLDLWPRGSRARGHAPDAQRSPVVSVVMPADDSYWKDEYDYQDGRNMLFLTHCAMEAGKRGMNAVITGFQQEDEEAAAEEGVPLDSGEDFLDAFNELVDNGGFLPSRAVHVWAPFLDLGMRKRHIALLAQELGVDTDMTLSCEFSYPPCGNCCNCVRRARGDAQARTMNLALA
jgi:7-cyano-7-deazaguanine synthase in queuosine biosynthesis